MDRQVKVGGELMNTEHWAEIIDDCKKARRCLYGSKHSDEWFREENRGHYYLLKAYLAAKESEEKDHIWYARILLMMARESKYTQSNYDILHLYLKPCMEAYHEAVSSNFHISPDEVKAASDEYERCLYAYNCYVRGEDEAYLLIEGLSADDGFQFHDSKVISFSHDMNHACLILEYEGIKKEFEFTGICEINVNCSDFESNWIFDCYCYRPWHTQKLICFDTESYKIICKKIRCKII